MSSYLEVINNQPNQFVPQKAEFEKWVDASLGGQEVELTIKIMGDNEIKKLNAEFRGIDKSTDVLSFNTESYNLDDTMPYLGDIAICASIINQFARENNIELKEHWAHITIHAVLHLLGYDHCNEDDKTEMRYLESKILTDLSLNDPWDLNLDYPTKNSQDI